MENKPLPKNDYERGWNDAFDLLCSMGLLTDVFQPMNAQQRDDMYRKFISWAKRRYSVEIIIPDKSGVYPVSENIFKETQGFWVKKK